MRLPILTFGLAVIFFGGYRTAQKDGAPQSAANVAASPLILEKNDGEQRSRRPRETPIPTSPFTIKVDRKNGGSQKMWLEAQKRFLRVASSQDISISAKSLDATSIRASATDCR
jgi:hypothetical protein